MSILGSLFNRRPSAECGRHHAGRSFRFETLESRQMMHGGPLPELMIVPQQQVDYCQEFGDERKAVESAESTKDVAEEFGQAAKPQQQPFDADVKALTADVDPEDHSAIVFVGGWGASMYQYDFPGDYGNNRLNVDLPGGNYFANVTIGDADSGAIVIVGGWGSSMYQYDFPGDYGLQAGWYRNA